MLSVKRLFYVILIVLVVSSIFMIYNINEEKSKTVKITNIPAVSEEFLAEVEISKDNCQKVYIVGDEEKEIYKDIYKNTKQILEDLHILYYETEVLKPEELRTDDLIIFCEDTLYTHTDLIQLGKFISKGGRVIFAAGLSEGMEDSYIWPFLGIREKSIRQNYNNLEFINPFLPLQFERAVYDGYSLSTWISVGKEAKKYIIDSEKKVPVLHTYDFEKGRVCLINGTFLADTACCGMLTGAMGSVMDDFIYPVMGVKAVFLDNFPMVTFVNDKVCMQMYGCSTEAFVRDIVWPQFQGMSLRTQTPYTSSVLTEASSDKSFPEINDSLFTTIGKSALQYEGELIHAANCKDVKKIYYNNEFIERFHEIFVNYEMNGLALISEELKEEMLNISGMQVKSVRGNLSSKARMKHNENYFVFPAGSYGNNMEDGNFFKISSVLGAYGMLSHVFDINTLIAEDENTASWDIDKKQIGLFEENILNKIPYLEGRTLSQTRNAVQSYTGLDYQWKREGNKVYLDCSNMRKGQTFFYKTNSKIVDAKGLIFEEAGNGYYLLQVEENNAIIELKER